MTPHEYQKRGIDEIIAKFATCDRVLYQLATGGGKTAVFSFLTQWWLQNHNTNVLILAHRTELIDQTESTLSAIGIGSEPITARVKTPKHHSRVYISMVETANNRLRKNPFFFPRVGLVICDECHILIFDKLFHYFRGAKILGCTATPCVMKRITFYKCPYCRTNYDEPTICCDEEAAEWSRPFSLSQIYQDIVIGPSIAELIEFGSIVPEITFIKHYTDDNNLRIDSDGEFTTESVEREYGSDNAVFNVLLNYQELCLGKKTLIFTPSTKTNLAVYLKFIEAGYQNVRMFDSVNKQQSGDREELLAWFANTPDAILLNVATFTTGFDSREVEAIIIDRPIGSLSLFIQIAGRGGRSSNRIYKPHFILVDGGGNVERFGEWSSDRDWEGIFRKGNGKERAKRENAIDIHDCPNCGALYPKSEAVCSECGHHIPQSEPRAVQVRESDEIMAPIRKIPPPNGERIYKYTVAQGENINFSFKIMIGQIIDMFRYYRVSADKYLASRESGELDRKLAKMIRYCYFVLLKKPDIQTEGRRTLAHLLERTKTQLHSYYEKSGKLNSAAVGDLVQE